MNTPIDILIDLLKKEEGIDFIPSWIIKKAKDIEREEIEAAYEEGFHAGGIIDQLHNLAEKYYEDTFNNQKLTP